MTAPFAVVEFSGAVGTHNTETGHSAGRDVAQMENADSYFINTYTEQHFPYLWLVLYLLFLWGQRLHCQRSLSNHKVQGFNFNTIANTRDKWWGKISMY